MTVTVSSANDAGESAHSAALIMDFAEAEAGWAPLVNIRKKGARGERRRRIFFSWRKFKL